MNIPSAKPSPRIQNGTLYWYEGDTFDLTLTISLEDQDGAAVAISSADVVTVTFRDCRGEAVKIFTFTGITGGKVQLDFNSTCAALFPKGGYTYTVVLTHGETTTLVRDNVCVVE